MSQSKRYFEAQFHDMRYEIDRALDRAQSHIDFSMTISELAHHNKKSREVLADFIDSFRELVIEDPEFFLTCENETLREAAFTILEDGKLRS